MLFFIFSLLCFSLEGSERASTQRSEKEIETSLEDCISQ